MAKLKRTTQDVADYFKQYGCELLDEYHGCMEPMDYKCNCGGFGTISWNNFTKGKRCGQCAKYGQSKKRSLNQVKEIFVNRGCEFLDKKFNGIHFKHRYKCKCGRRAKITFGAFYYQKQCCRKCGLDKMRGSKNPAWRSDREQLELDKRFRKRCYKALQSTLKAVGKEKVGHTSDMLGYGPKELQEHIRNHPEWTRVKDGNWHLDHIWPIKAFLDHGINDVALINCLENLRPSTQKANNEKWAHYEPADFHDWLRLRN